MRRIIQWMLVGTSFWLVCLRVAAAGQTGDSSEGPVFETISVSLRLAIEDLQETFPDKYTQADEYLARLDALQKQAASPDRDAAILELQRESLLANPLLGFEDLLLVRRKSERDRGLPANWQGNERLPRKGYTNDIALWSPSEPDAPLRTVYRPEEQLFVGDLDLHFGAERLLFSMRDENGSWRVHELTLGRDSTEPRQLPLIPDADVDNYDACYLPDGSILFTSTATYTGVPCVKGNSHVANIYRLDAETGAVRRLTFDQDHNWNPTVLNNGRVMYLRWEYSDLPHFVARILFHMNPDGTNQSEYYGSGSYWPNSFFYARSVPDHPTRVVGIVTGHHGARREGELVILDPALGRREADGVVQRIPGRGKKVEPLILDRLVDESWPKFLHPYPLSSKYFLVSIRSEGESSFSLCLADVFDNLVVLRSEEGYDLFEPLPLVPKPTPPVVPNRVDLDQDTATVYLEDVYHGEGLQGVPRGTVKNLRLVTYHFAYRGMGGQQDPLGLDGPWDIKCVLGTVPVEEDGSALFRVPANMPISFQPLDAEGKAIQLMRSWSTAMPGENVSCVGCHEQQNTVPVAKLTTASRRSPSEIEPWFEPSRGVSFKREVEPVVDAYCGECHHEDQDDAPPIGDAYMFLRRLVRTPTIEPDMHVLEPYEYHADTTELVRMLQQGHYGVRLNEEAWNRIVTWIDLNAPRFGAWVENVGAARMGQTVERRRDLMQRYAGIDGINEAPVFEETSIVAMPPQTVESPEPSEPPKVEMAALPEDWAVETMSVALPDGSTLDFVRVPAGSYSVGKDEITIGRPFWMSKYEITNAQYGLFDPEHDSRLEPLDFLHFDPHRRGSPLNGPNQPVAKISQEEASTYCSWLSQAIGAACRLPTEHEWEWACRAGTEGDFWYGADGDEFSRFANMADLQFHTSIANSVASWKPAITDQDDGYRVSSPVGTFDANPWGLCDMHGNVAEWTSSEYAPRSDSAVREYVVRGGSWSDRPQWAGASARWGYPYFQKVYNVGFRVVLTEQSANE